VKCAWCPAEATIFGTLAVCDAHEAGLDELADAQWRMRLRWRFAVSATAERRILDLDSAVLDRDARELRGEPPSMEGWVLW